MLDLEQVTVWAAKDASVVSRSSRADYHARVVSLWAASTMSLNILLGFPSFISWSASNQSMHRSHSLLVRRTRSSGFVYKCQRLQIVTYPEPAE